MKLLFQIIWPQWPQKGPLLHVGHTLESSGFVNSRLTVHELSMNGFYFQFISRTMNVHTTAQFFAIESQENLHYLSRLIFAAVWLRFLFLWHRPHKLRPQKVSVFSLPETLGLR